MITSYKNITSIKYIITLGLSSVLLATAPVAPAKAESLLEAVDATLSNHPRHEVALLQIEAAEQKRKEQRSAFFPVLRGGASGGRIYGDNSTSRGLNVTRGAGYSWLWEGNVSLTQNLFNGLGTINRHSAAKERETAAEYTKDDVREMLTMETVLAYIDVLRCDESLAVLEEYLGAMQNYEPQFKVLVDQGAVDSTDQNQASDMVSRLENLIYDFEAQKQSALSRYKMMTGRMPETALVKAFPPLNIPDDVDMATAWALENHPQILAALGESNAAWHDSEVEKSAFFPKLDSEFSYMKKDQEDVIGGEVVDARALLKMNWAFSTGGAEINKFKHSRKLYQEALAKRRDLERTLTNNIQSSWIERNKLNAQKQVGDRRLSLSKALLSTRGDQFEGGQISLLELMQAHNQDYGLQLEAIQLDHAQLSSDFMVLANMGALYSRLTPQAADSLVMPAAAVEEVVETPQNESDEEYKIEEFCDHHQGKPSKGKAATDKAKELCPSAAQEL